MQSGLKTPSIYCSHPQHSQMRASVFTDPVTDVMSSELPLSLPDILRERRGGSSPLGPPFRKPSTAIHVFTLTTFAILTLDSTSRYLIVRHQVASYATIHLP